MYCTLLFRCICTSIQISEGTSWSRCLYPRIVPNTHSHTRRRALVWLYLYSFVLNLMSIIREIFRIEFSNPSSCKYIPQLWNRTWADILDHHPKFSLNAHSISESGNMIIMLLAHLQASGDDTIIDQHVSANSEISCFAWLTFRFLVFIDKTLGRLSCSEFTKTKCPVSVFAAHNFVINVFFRVLRQTSSSDGILSLNQTNLSLKGIIGIGAMAKISHFMGMESDASNYQVRNLIDCFVLMFYACHNLKSVAESYIGKWQNLSLSQNQTRLLTTFQTEGSAGLIYNMYADKLLQINLIPQSVSFSIIPKRCF